MMIADQEYFDKKWTQIRKLKKQLETPLNGLEEKKECGNSLEDIDDSNVKIITKLKRELKEKDERIEKLRSQIDELENPSNGKGLTIAQWVVFFRFAMKKQYDCAVKEKVYDMVSSLTGKGRQSIKEKFSSFEKTYKEKDIRFVAEIVAPVDNDLAQQMLHQIEE